MLAQARYEAREVVYKALHVSDLDSRLKSHKTEIIITDSALEATKRNKSKLESDYEQYIKTIQTQILNIEEKIKTSKEMNRKK